MVRVTSARPKALRSPAPAKMTSCILPPRRVFALPSPITQARASTTLDFPEPLGPTTAQIPGSNFNVVADAKDLNPLSVNDFKCIVIILQSESANLSTPCRAINVQYNRTRLLARLIVLRLLPPVPGD